MTVLVIGATGTTGSRVADRLRADGRAVRAASRGAAGGPDGVRFDWLDPSTHGAALHGVESVYLVPPVGVLHPEEAMLPFLERAKRAGVRRAVLLSSSQLAPGGPATGAVHAALPEVFGEWAVLRPSWFMQNFTGGHVHAESIRAEGRITTAAAAGRVAFIDAGDIAAVAVRALTDRTPHNTDWILTGPGALSYDDVAATIARVSGRPVRHRAVSRERMREHLAGTLPDGFAAMLADLDGLIAGGAEDRVTGAVEQVTGRPPRSFEAFAAAHAGAFGAP
ncbi:NAD-dependent epimerase/dehydratase family protein [Actinomadura sp. WMMB 499]|uniref:NAD-dependent epimerase/dehydratase family protein n=1 Tax=Actinomadura sp. WMMB 499 TaxID=1219491 RepID=UPI001247D29C|nr:NAD-dependent epimerase/dehydratase family protein [Actinomadura sp. WMMB 499]QFG23204.1 NAD(P)H-binding protein [Actinomadura sp. WMMB 499]